MISGEIYDFLTNFVGQDTIKSLKNVFSAIDHMNEYSMNIEINSHKIAAIHENHCQNALAINRL